MNSNIVNSTNLDTDRNPNITANNDFTAQSYSEVWYYGGIFPNTHPDHLYTLGTLYQINPTPPDKCRVLEIGCAIGTNLLPLAMVYKDCEFIGIDLSSAQIEEANALKNEAKLTNIQFIQTDVCLYEKHQLGMFDYIIVHGVFSWCSEEAQHKTLELCQKLLNKNGMALISYNCYPGWHHLMPIRDAMNMHASHFKDRKEALNQAKAYMNYVFESMPTQDGTIGKYLKDRYNNSFAKAQDYYLHHELLETINQPLYFSEFIKMASKFSLKFLAETDPQYMMKNNLTEKFIELAGRTNNRTTIEQLYDFISNRQFRSTILIHKDNPIEMNWNPSTIKDFAFAFNPHFVKKNDGVWYYKEKVVELSSSNATVEKLLTHMNINRVPLTSEKLAEAIGCSPEDTHNFFQQHAISLYSKSLLKFYGHQIELPDIDEQKLHVHPLIRAYTKRSYAHMLPNLLKMQTNIDEVDKLILPHLDGTINADGITDILQNALKQNRISLNSNNNENDERSAEEIQEEHLQFLQAESHRRVQRYISKALLSPAE